MSRTRTRVTSFLVAALMVALAAPASVWAQATSSQLAGQGFRPADGHVHEGELGEMLLAIERNIRCNCSCGLDVHTCQFRMSCDVSPGWSQRIMAQLQAGQDRATIEAGFVADFGGTVLMAPPAEGFNLVGYLLPSVAIVVAGMLIGLIARGGARAPAPARQLSDAEAERLRDALRRLDESEGPDW
jgi:cytochrome c-type biogenesis protein CcmH/NrfF